jgi:MFS family permease
MQRVLGDSAAISGLSLLPTAAVIGAVSLGFSARIAARFGNRVMLLTGLLFIAVALGLLASVPVHASYPAHLLGPMVLFGAGGGLTLPALASLAMSGATERDAGVASGLFNTTQQIGAALGVAVLSTLAAARTASLQAAGRGSASALTSGYRLAFATGAGLAVAAVIVAAILLRNGGSAAHRSKITETVSPGARV